MIRYTLKCENDHRFESWFQSAESFDTLSKAGHTTCPSCGSPNVVKELMAPTVRPARKGAKDLNPPTVASDQPVANVADNDVTAAVKKLKAYIEKNSEYVGPRFAEEARAIHEGDTPERAIHGEANAEEAKRLADDGIAALPLPFITRQKTN